MRTISARARAAALQPRAPHRIDARTHQSANVHDALMLPPAAIHANIYAATIIAAYGWLQRCLLAVAYVCTQHPDARLCAAAARAAPMAEKQLAPQFCLVRITGFYKDLKFFLSHTCALEPIRPESTIKITWCHATTSSFCLLLSAGPVSAPAVLQNLAWVDILGDEYCTGQAIPHEPNFWSAPPPPPFFLEDENIFSKIGHVGCNSFAIPLTTNVDDF
jgi:hypothetical protein